MSFVSEVYRPLSIDRAAIERANNVSHFDAGDGIAREADSVYRAGLEEFAPRLCPENTWTPEQRQIAEKRADAWRALCEESYSDVLRRRASWVPVSVAGPSGYDSKKNGKRADAELEASAQWREKRERFLENTRAMIERAQPIEKALEQYRNGKRRETISFDDPHAAAKLRARIEGIKERREEGKRMNAHFKKHGTMKGYPGVTDDRAAELDAEIAGTWYKQPCAPFTLSNSLANLKRLEERLQEAERRAAAPAEESAPEIFDGFRVVRDPADNRLRFIFDDKPDDETRAILKRHGLHWSPSAQAWQRQLTPNALHDARRYIIPELLSSGKYARIEAMTPEQFALSYAE